MEFCFVVAFITSFTTIDIAIDITLTAHNPMHRSPFRNCLAQYFGVSNEFFANFASVPGAHFDTLALFGGRVFAKWRTGGPRH